MSSSVQKFTTNYVPPADNAVTSTQSPASDQFKVGLDDIMGVATQGAQIAGAINYQRQQSGASARRQSRVAQCGRKPLFGRQRKEEYRKCIADYNAGLTTNTTTTTNTNDNKNLSNDEGGSSMKFVWIGLAVVALGGIGYMLYKKSK
jgi:hypothetical protein